MKYMLLFSIRQITKASSDGTLVLMQSSTPGVKTSECHDFVCFESSEKRRKTVIT